LPFYFLAGTAAPPLRMFFDDPDMGREMIVMHSLPEERTLALPVAVVIGLDIAYGLNSMSCGGMS